MGSPLLAEQSSPATRTSDVGCTPCKPGTFSLGGWAQECTEWTSCGVGSHIFSQGTLYTVDTGAWPAINVCVCARACRLPMWALLPFSHPPALNCNIPGSRTTLPARRSTAGTSVRDVDCRPCPPGSWDADSLPTTACEDCASGSSYSTVDGNRCVTVCAADESELTQPTKFEDRK